MRILREAPAGLLRLAADLEKALILTAVGRPDNLRRGIAAEVAGFMLKDAGPDELSAAIRTVAGGGRVIDPQPAFAALGAQGSPLTSREADVLRLTARGATPREVAQWLRLTYGTVRNYPASASARWYASAPAAPRSGSGCPTGTAPRRSRSLVSPSPSPPGEPPCARPRRGP
ncbi:hypothetical protein DMB42_14155 [Nonomuraea sp. WAC 01424]|nr:hypothetical protein DMB42_14155 [Nonomuraea sp. WAC 01424]